jgi:hypothetical protein
MTTKLPSFLDKRSATDLCPDDFHPYQVRAIQHQCSMPASALWLFMSAGKSIITLTSISHLQAEGWLGPVLVVAPLTVVETVWEQQAKEWTHTRHLRFSRITGTASERLHKLHRKADIYLINYENLSWLTGALINYFLAQGRTLPFEGLVWDEISKMKNAESKRAQTFYPLLQYFKWRTGLTGTPAGNGVIDLHGQFKMLDGGYRLGVDKKSFEERFTRQAGPYGREQLAGTEDIIKTLVSDIVLEMNQKDYLDLPDIIVNDIPVELPQRLRERYDELENNLFLELDSGLELDLENAGAKTNKALQFAAGAVYTDTQTKTWEKVHDLKYEQLDRVIEEAAGEPVLAAYQFVPEALTMMKRYKELKPVNLTGHKNKAQAIDDWVAGKTRLMIGHPASMGHGTDRLQRRGHILAWGTGLNWSLELYEQFNSRLQRQGMDLNKPVIMHRIYCPGTMDDAQRLAIETKAHNQKAIREAIRSYREQKGM